MVMLNDYSIKLQDGTMIDFNGDVPKVSLGEAEAIRRGLLPVPEYAKRLLESSLAMPDYDTRNYILIPEFDPWKMNLQPYMRE